MNKEELVKTVATKARMTQREAYDVVNLTIEVMAQALAKQGRVTLVGFGSFQVRERAAREGRNPRTGAVLSIPSKKTVVFVAGKLLRERVATKTRTLVGAGRKK